MSHIDTTYKKWFDWSSKVQEDIKRTVYHHEIWMVFSERVRENIDHLSKLNAGIFLNFLKLTYTDSAVIGARRQIKKSSDEISLMRLLEDMKSQSSLLTLERYCLFHGDNQGNRDAFYFYSNGLNLISNELLDSDIRKLKFELSKIENFADCLVAHPSKKALSDDKRPTWDDLINGIGALSGIGHRWTQFHLRQGLLELKPVILDDWISCLTVPFFVK